MKTSFPLVFLVIALILGCEKDQITRGDIIGDWILETKHVDTIYSSGSVVDTTIIKSDIKYIINSSDTLTICSLEDNYCGEFWMNYKPPNIISYNTCPIDNYCLISITLEYKILKATNNVMIWRREYKL